jgi:PleD family two-component response regulator
VHVDDLSSEATLALSALFPTRAEACGRLLVVGGESCWGRSIRSIFEPRAFDVCIASSAQDAVNQMHRSLPEAAIVVAQRDGGSAIGLVRRLRREGLDAARPIVVVAEVPLRRERRLEALRAGAWDLLSIPFSGHELLVKIESYLCAKRANDRAKDQILIDPTTGLFNVQGLLRCAAALGEAARRHQHPFGCAVFSPTASTIANLDDPRSRGWPQSADTLAVEIAALLKIRARESDVLARVSEHEYVVLAPDTGPTGIVALARRFVEADIALEPSANIPLRAGCHAVSNVAVAGVGAAQIVAHATIALRQSPHEVGGSIELWDAQTPPAF